MDTKEHYQLYGCWLLKFCGKLIVQIADLKTGNKLPLRQISKSTYTYFLGGEWVQVDCDQQCVSWPSFAKMFHQLYKCCGRPPLSACDIKDAIAEAVGDGISLDLGDIIINNPTSGGIGGKIPLGQIICDLEHPYFNCPVFVDATGKQCVYDYETETWIKLEGDLKLNTKQTSGSNPQGGPQCCVEDCGIQMLGDGNPVDQDGVRALLEGAEITKPDGTKIAFDPANAAHHIFGFDFELVHPNSDIQTDPADPAAVTATTTCDASYTDGTKGGNLDPGGHFVDTHNPDSPSPSGPFSITPAAGSGIKAVICIGVCVSPKTGEVVNVDGSAVKSKAIEGEAVEGETGEG